MDKLLNFLVLNVIAYKMGIVLPNSWVVVDEMNLHMENI